MGKLDYGLKAPIPQEAAAELMRATNPKIPIEERIVDAADFLETHLAPDDFKWFKADYEGGIVSDELLVRTAQQVAARFLFGRAT